MKDLLWEECRDRVNRALINRGEKTQRQVAYRIAIKIRKLFNELMHSLEADIF